MKLQRQQVRLLPWSDPMGRPCYLSTTDGRGYVSRLADRVEAEQLDTGAEFIEYAGELLDGGKVTHDDLMYLAGGLTEALRNTLRIAKSRGERLTAAEDEGDTDKGDDDGDVSQVRAEACA